MRGKSGIKDVSERKRGGGGGRERKGRAEYRGKERITWDRVGVPWLTAEYALKKS